MIYTRFGSWVRTIAWFDHDTGEAEFVCRYDDGSEKTRTAHITELKADGGVAEIINAAIEHRNKYENDQGPK